MKYNQSKDKGFQYFSNEDIAQKTMIKIINKYLKHSPKHFQNRKHRDIADMYQTPQLRLLYSLCIKSNIVMSYIV